MSKPKTKADERIARLEERRARINAEIQRTRARLSQLERKKDTRRKILAGAWILDKVEHGEWPKQQLLEGLDAYLERDHDRALFGLPPKRDRTGQIDSAPEPMPEDRSDGLQEQTGQDYSYKNRPRSNDNQKKNIH